MPAEFFYNTIAKLPQVPTVRLRALAHEAIEKVFELLRDENP